MSNCYRSLTKPYIIGETSVFLNKKFQQCHLRNRTLYPITTVNNITTFDKKTIIYNWARPYIRNE